MVRPGESRIFRAALDLWTIVVMVFLVAPLLVAAINSIGSSDLAVFPPRDFSLAAYGKISSRWTSSIFTSVLVSGIATVIGIVAGICAAFALARATLPLPSVFDTLLRSPLQVPAVVCGVAFLLLYGLVRDVTGLDPRESLLGLILAQSAYAIPFVLAVVLPRLLAFDRALEQAAYGLGASRFVTLRRVTLPILAPAIFAGGFLAFFMSFDNLPLSMFLVGSGIKIFPVEMFAGIQFEVTRTVYAVATVVALGSGLVVLLAYRSIKTLAGSHD